MTTRKLSFKVVVVILYVVHYCLGSFELELQRSVVMSVAKRAK
jgi:hypothetical protein